MYFYWFVISAMFSSQVLCHTCPPDYCKDIPTNGNYKSFGIYRKHKIQTFEVYEGSLRIYRDDIEIEVEVTSDMTLRAIQRFREDKPIALYKFDSMIDWGKDFLGWVDCGVYTRSTPQYMRMGVTKCTAPNSTFQTSDDLTDYPSHPVIIGSQDSHRDTIVYNSMDKKERFLYFVAGRKFPCEVNKCDLPFIEQIDDQLFARIRGVVSIMTANHTVSWAHYFVILYQRNGWPKYCMTSMVGNLSEECSSEEKMKTLFPECMAPPMSSTTSTISTSPKSQTDDCMNPLIWIVIVIVMAVVIIILIIVISVMLWKGKQTNISEDKIQLKPKSTTSKSTLKSNSSTTVATM